MVTHDAAAASVADLVVLLADGRRAATVDQPTPSSVLAALHLLEG
jgi:ABC-type lipoprotein export system ATPase subunit